MVLLMLPMAENLMEPRPWSERNPARCMGGPRGLHSWDWSLRLTIQQAEALGTCASDNPLRVVGRFGCVGVDHALRVDNRGEANIIALLSNNGGAPLDSVESKGRYPSRDACLEMLKRRGVPLHVIVHSMQVSRVARFLAQKLNLKGEGLNLELVEAASLLHDISKMDGLRTGENHAKAAGRLLREMGHERVARVVEQHVVAEEVPGLVRITEEELVNYSDKRVMHDRIVTLEERFEDLKERYGRSPESRAIIGSHLERARKIERKIFEKLCMRPEELEEQLSCAGGI